MRNYLLKRIAVSAFSLLGRVILVFFLARMTGSPADLYLPIDVPNEVRREFAERHGLNEPIVWQFIHFIRDLVHLDLGQSLRLGRPALTLVVEAFPTTLLLALFAMTLAISISIVTGALAAWRPGGLFDRIATLLSLAAASIPNFWIAIVGVIVFAVVLRVLPTSGTDTPLHWVLPIAVLFIRPCGLLVQVVRSSMLSALGAAFVKTARAKGVSTRTILFVHALRNAMLPVITVAGDQAAGIINGAVVVETIFGFPGIGKLMIDSIIYRDFAVIQAGVLLTAILIFALNIGIDLLYAMLDPRIRHS